MLTKRRILTKYLAVFILCMLLAGCWDRTELNKIGIASATAIDWVNDHWQISYQLVIPQSISSQNAGGGSTQQAPVMVFSTIGDSIQTAIQRASLEMPRTLFFAHNRVMIIGEDAARKGIAQLIDNYLRSSTSRETVSVLVTRGTGRKILEQLVPMEKIPGAAIQDMMLNEDKHDSDLKQVMVYQLAMSMAGDSGYSTVPEIFIAGKGEEANSIEELKSTIAETKLKMGKIGVFKKDKLIGWLTIHDGFGINWITNRIDQTVLFFSCSPESKKFQSAVRIIHAKTRLKPVQQDGQWVMKANVQATAQLVENGCDIDPSKREGIQALENLINHAVTVSMQDALNSTQAIKADVLGFAASIHKNDPKAWKQMKENWDKTFPQVRLETTVNISIERLGMSSKSFADILKGIAE
ncbi:Ger(x)C family spore germination protein [Paenibacillus aestuarii]|uniref:Ger(X)C family spore germination protein n=1 Tax=Paenibacillus aestuarii TaxID=516965 RepID=A0ABW0K8E5_9BACL|nr:Ger(x)C family spore germination protein [Paenibacillus aestuarii]